MECKSAIGKKEESGCLHENQKEEEMDKAIKDIQKTTKRLEKKESKLLKADKKRDKVCELGEKHQKAKKARVRTAHGAKKK